MDEKDKKIAALEKDLAKVKQQLKQLLAYVKEQDKKISRVSHNQSATSSAVSQLTAALRRVG